MTLFNNLEWPLRSPELPYSVWPYLIHLQSITSSLQTFKYRCFVLHTLKLNLMLMSNTFFFRCRLIVKRAKRCTQNQGVTRKQVRKAFYYYLVNNLYVYVKCFMFTFICISICTAFYWIAFSHAGAYLCTKMTCWFLI